MAFTVECYCGHMFSCVPPAECPCCGVPVTDGRDARTDAAWLTLIRDELGTAGTTSYDPDHESW